MNRQTAFIQRTFSLVLCLLLVAGVTLSCAHGREPGKTVRVGWYESTFNTMDHTGRRSGYAYEYQLKLAAYAGWQYEYVSGTWSTLLEMLEAGEIDLMSDVSYRPEREERMLFPTLPMGTEEYYLFISPGNTEITPADFGTLNGKKIGVNRGSVQAQFYLDWAARNGIEAQLIDLVCSEEESVEMMNTGELDAYVTVDSFAEPEKVLPVCKLGSSDFYFVVNKARPDLLRDLESAISRIQDEDRFYNQQLFEKYFKRTGANAFLTQQEVDWLAGHGPIRVGYQDNYLAFCAQENGELTGALKEYLALAADCTANAHMNFEARAYPTAAAMVEAVQKGEVDCIFPVSLTAYDGETLGLILTPPIMSSHLYAVVRSRDQKIFSNREHVVAAVNWGDLNNDAILLDHFPNWRKVYFPSMEERLKAVAEGVADCVLISNYRANNIARLCEKHHLTTFVTGVDVDYCMAVLRQEGQLYSILCKTAGLVPSSAVNAALSDYVTEDARVTLTELVSDNLAVVVTVVFLVLGTILFLLFRSMRAERKAQRLIQATERDDLTGLYTRKFFFQYANRLLEERPDTPMDAIVINIEQFHSVNALKGREFGDQVLRALGQEIWAEATQRGGIGGRFGADRFDIFCKHTAEYRDIYQRLQNCLDRVADNTTILLRMGVMPWQADTEPVQLFDMARVACSMARGKYNQHLIIFDDKVRERELYEQRLVNDLDRALDEFQFDVYYQPKFDIQSEPPRLVSTEALVRWRHPELGTIPPMDFVPLFERNGQIGKVDKYVWNEAARQVARWRDEYGVIIPVSVNLSRVDMFDPELEETLESILQYNGLGYRDFKLEVTESAYTESADQVVRVVEELRGKGYQVLMDDFGTGYSSLNMLSEMPVDVLKMDRGFIRNIDHEEKGIKMVALILDIAKSLKIPVVAEGVETEQQMRMLKNLGCAMVQGYYFSRPLQSLDFEETYLRSKQQ